MPSCAGHSFIAERFCGFDMFQESVDSVGCSIAERAFRETDNDQVYWRSQVERRYGKRSVVGFNDNVFSTVDHFSGGWN